MLHGVAPVRTDVAEERIAFIIRVTTTGELGVIDKVDQVKEWCLLHGYCNI
jgi:hypothetical protein